MDPLTLLEPTDLVALMRLEPFLLVGRLMDLNRTARYHNSLDALAIAQRIADLREPVRSIVHNSRSVELHLGRGNARSTFVPADEKP